MSDTRALDEPLDSSIPPYVPPEADGDVRSVLRTPWARRWALVVLLLMLAWTAAAWWINSLHFHQRLDGAIDAATTQARERGVLVEDGLRQGLAKLDGAAHVLTRLPAVRQAVVAAGPGRLLVDEPVPELRSMLQAQPELAVLNATSRRRPRSWAPTWSTCSTTRATASPPATRAPRAA